MDNMLKATTGLAAAALLAGAYAISPAFAAGSPGTETKTQALLEALEAGGGKPMETLSPADARQVLVNAQQGTPLPAADVSRKVVQLNGEDITLYIVKPEGATSTLPVFMYFHGGGWVIGDFPTHERLVRDLVIESGAAAVFVDYTRSPEVRFPTAINQAYAATKWVAENGHEIGVDGDRLSVAGNSAGGNMAAVVSLMAKKKGTPAIRSQVLFWPVTDANFDNASYNTYAEGHFLTKNMMKWFWDSYTADPAERNQILASPLRASLEELKGLPPTLIQTAEKDVLRDEGEAYARKLDQAGVPVIVARYNGMIHDFGLINALADLPSTRAAIEQAGQQLKMHLNSPDS